jgi:hypothetical protein
LKGASERLLGVFKKKTIRVFFNTGSSGDLLFMERESTKCIPIARKAVLESCSTSISTFKTMKVGNVELSFI